MKYADVFLWTEHCAIKRPSIGNHGIIWSSWLFMITSELEDMLSCILSWTAHLNVGKYILILSSLVLQNLASSELNVDSSEPLQKSSFYDAIMLIPIFRIKNITDNVVMEVIICFYDLLSVKQKNRNVRVLIALFLRRRAWTYSKLWADHNGSWGGGWIAERATSNGSTQPTA